MKTTIVTPWHNREQLEKFYVAWGLYDSGFPDFLHLQQDKDRSGCAVTKNRGIQTAIEGGAEVIIVLDDDCFPNEETPTLDTLVRKHLEALEPQQVEMFEIVTDPPSRGTPYFNRTIEMPVAASMGFWTDVGDYDAPGQLVHGARKPMEFKRKAIHGKYFPLCGMNLAFRSEWWPWCQFIDVPRFDDIWQGFLWQKKSYAEGYCFNLNGPTVRHSRQSDVFANLRDEAISMERNETIWRDIAKSKAADYQSLVKEIL